MGERKWMRNGTASQLLTNSLVGGDSTDSVIHIRHYEGDDKFPAVSYVLCCPSSRVKVFLPTRTSCTLPRHVWGDGAEWKLRRDVWRWQKGQKPEIDILSRNSWEKQPLGKSRTATSAFRQKVLKKKHFKWYKTIKYKPIKTGRE